MSTFREPTVYDVAKIAGVSIATVSRVLNSPDLVREATRSKVMTVIDNLGFVPKAEAHARARKSVGRIGVLTPFFTAPSFVQRIRGITTGLVGSNYELVIYPVDTVKRLRGYLDSLPLTRGLDGLIVLSLPISEEDTQRLIRHHIQGVLIEHYQDSLNTVEINDVFGGKLAAQYLIGKGHRRLAFIGDLYPPDYAIQPALKRLTGFKQALAEADLPFPDEYCRASSSDQKDTRRVAQEMLSTSHPPTAIFAAADIQAAAVMKVATDLGLSMPRDLAVIGFDDVDMADYIGLTTINQHLDDSGRIAVELLLARLTDSHRSVQHVTLPLMIVERGSV